MVMRKEITNKREVRMKVTVFHKRLQTHTPKKKNFFFGVPLLFLLLIMIPGSLTLFALVTGKNIDWTLKGNFDPVKTPVLSAASVLDQSFQNDFEIYFHNTFTGRGYMITTYNQIRHSLFGENPQSCISNSFIHEPYILAYMGINDYNYDPPEKMADMEEYINRLWSVSNLLKERRKSLIYVLAPGKAAWFKDDIPARYTRMPHGQNISDCFERMIGNTDIIYLNAGQYLNEISLPYPVFYKSSHHWSRTAEIEVEKKILEIINEKTSFLAETYDIASVEESAFPIDRDADTWNLMNLWIPTDDTYYRCETITNKVDEQSNICIQGDSYASLIARDFFVNGHNGMVSYIGYDNDYYVNNELVQLLEHDFSSLDMEKIVDENDIFIILYTDYNLSGYGYGFVDALYNCLNSSIREE